MAEIRADDERRRPPRFDVGDRVIATHPLGGFWRPRVPRGTPAWSSAAARTLVWAVAHPGMSVDSEPDTAAARLVGS